MEEAEAQITKLAHCMCNHPDLVGQVETIMISIISMLSSPNDESAANVDAAKEWRDDRVSPPCFSLAQACGTCGRVLLSHTLLSYERTHSRRRSAGSCGRARRCCETLKILN
jgi:hypothetical protein